MYFSASSSGGTPSFYVEVYKYNGTTFTLLGSSATTPEGITNGTAIDIYYTSVGIPETVLTITDRLAIRVYVDTSGRTITLHTEDNHLSEIVTTFSNGLTALNGLTKQAQYFAVGSTGTDFNISSSVDTHTFNIPSASASNRGLITTGTQTFAGAKTLTGALTGATATFTNSGSGIGVGVTNSGSGDGIKITHSLGRAFNIQSSSTGYGIIINNETASTSVPFTIQKQGSTVITMTDAGGATFGGAVGVTGQLTLGSTITNGTYTYTLPSATGTLALTSALSGYLPLTGGTLSNNLTISASTGNSPLRFTSTTASSKTGYLYADATIIGITDTLNAGVGLGGIFFNSTTKETLLFNNGNVSLTLASNSSATFASSVSTTELKLNNISALIHVSSYNVLRDTDANNAIILGNSSTPQNFYNNTEHIFRNRTGTTSYLNITSAGNVGIGTTTPSSAGGGYTGLDIRGTTGSSLVLGSTTTLFTYIYASASAFTLETTSSIPILFASAGTERIRITSGGALKVSNNGVYLSNTAPYHEFTQTNTDTNTIIIRNTAASPYGNYIGFSATPNNTTNYFLAVGDSSQDKLIIWSNGSVQNRTGSYGTISDIKFKENIVDATPKLADLMQLKVRNFNMIGDETKQIGFIAQEFEEVFPKMIDISTDKESGEEYKSIKTSVLVPMLVKAIQEQQAQIEELKAKIK
jgi:hypothetical protein